jgi:[protein-PII] uridylyltransferase
MIRSAHIATYGERAVDVFYLTDLGGREDRSDPERVERLRAELLIAALEPGRRAATAPSGASRKERPPPCGEGLLRPERRSLRSGSGR